MNNRETREALRCAPLMIALAAAALLQGCASSGSLPTVPRSAAGKIQTVETGTVIATRPIAIDGEATIVGRSSGAVVGSAIGQTAGEGSGRVLAAAGGAVVGGIVGGMVEKELTKRQAQELTIDLDDGPTVVVVQAMQGVGLLEGDRVRVTYTPSGEALVAPVYEDPAGYY